MAWPPLRKPSNHLLRIFESHGKTEEQKTRENRITCWNRCLRPVRVTPALHQNHLRTDAARRRKCAASRHLRSNGPLQPESLAHKHQNITAAKRPIHKRPPSITRWRFPLRQPQQIAANPTASSHPSPTTNSMIKLLLLLFRQKQK